MFMGIHEHSPWTLFMRDGKACYEVTFRSAYKHHGLGTCAWHFYHMYQHMIPLTTIVNCWASWCQMCSDVNRCRRIQINASNHTILPFNSTSSGPTLCHFIPHSQCINVTSDNAPLNLLKTVVQWVLKTVPIPFPNKIVYHTYCLDDTHSPI